MTMPRGGAVGFEQRVQPMPNAEMQDEGRRFNGTAVVFDTWALIGSPDYGFRERWATGSLDKTLRESDIVFLDGHDPKCPISRVSADTLRLNARDDGLGVDSDMDTRVSYVNDLAINVANRNVKGMSFGFRVTKDEWVRGSDGVDERTVREAAVHEISATAFPAFVTTDAAVRSAVLTAKIRRGDLTRADLRSIRDGAPLPDLQRLGRQFRRALQERRSMTANDTYASLNEAVGDYVSDLPGGDRCFGIVVDYDDTFVYYTVYDWDNDDDDTFRQTYTLADDGMATLTGEPQQVRQRNTYVPVTDPDDDTSDGAGDTTDTGEPPNGTRSATSEPAEDATREVDALRRRMTVIASRNGDLPTAVA